MPKLVKEMGALEVSRLRKEGMHAVGGVTGLNLRIVGQSRGWVLRYTFNSIRRPMGLGSFPSVTLAMAREKAREAQLKISQGVDPISHRGTLRAQGRLAAARKMLFRDAAAKCIQLKTPEWSNAKHASQWTATMETYVYPFIGDLDVAEVETPHLLKILQPIWETKRETASRVRGRVETILNWATAHGSRDGLNPARWTGHLDQLLSKPNKMSKTRHHEAVPYRDVNKVLQAIGMVDGQGARALRFQVLTAVRSGEVREAKWSEIDMESGLWTIPAERMKARREHRVPLSEQAMALLTGQPRIDGCDWVFPGAKEKPLSNMAMTAVMRRLGLTAVPHGFRSTFRDWAAECTEHVKDVVEMALAHTIENKVEAAYRRGDLLEKRIPLMQAWADYCELDQ